jgi:acyl-coenzyme A synthetase/AMP-(fatty) acid ligase
MLYPLWLETVRQHASRVAVHDAATGESVSFAELARRAAALPAATAPVIARSGDLAFVLEVLRAWRDGQAVVPVERDRPAPWVPHDLPPEVVLVKHTPGATGIPRGIWFTADQLAAEARRLVAAMEMGPRRPNLAVISLAHSYGFSNLVLPLLLHGIPLHALPVPFPQAVAQAFAAHPSLTVPAVPSMWRAWHRSGVLRQAPIALALSAGAPLPLDLEQAVHDATGLKLRNFYGTSESGGISLDSSATPRSDPADVGTALDGVQVSVHPSGRLLVASDAVGIGYDELREGDLLGNGLFLTRDLGETAPGGRVRLLGSAGAAINVAGRKISPTRVEAALANTPQVRRARVLGVPSPDPDRVEEIAALVELVPGSTLAELKNSAAEQLASWELPRHWRIDPPAAVWALDTSGLRRWWLTKHPGGCASDPGSKSQVSSGTGKTQDVI